MINSITNSMNNKKKQNNNRPETRILKQMYALTNTIIFTQTVRKSIPKRSNKKNIKIRRIFPMHTHWRFVFNVKRAIVQLRQDEMILVQVISICQLKKIKNNVNFIFSRVKTN